MMLRILSQHSMSQLTDDLTQSPESGAHSGRRTCSWGTLVWATAARGRHAQVCSRGHGEAWLSPPGPRAPHTDTHACTQTHAHSWTGTHGYASRRPCTPPGPPGRPPHPVAVLPLTGHVQGRPAPLVGDGRALAVVDAGRARFVVELQAGRRQVQLWADRGVEGHPRARPPRVQRPTMCRPGPVPPAGSSSHPGLPQGHAQRCPVSHPDSSTRPHALGRWGLNEARVDAQGAQPGGGRLGGLHGGGGLGMALLRQGCHCMCQDQTLPLQPCGPKPHPEGSMPHLWPPGPSAVSVTHSAACPAP